MERRGGDGGGGAATIVTTMTTRSKTLALGASKGCSHPRKATALSNQRQRVIMILPSHMVATAQHSTEKSHRYRDWLLSVSLPFSLHVLPYLYRIPWLGCEGCDASTIDERFRPLVAIHHAYALHYHHNDTAWIGWILLCLSVPCHICLREVPRIAGISINGSKQ